VARRRLQPKHNQKKTRKRGVGGGGGGGGGYRVGFFSCNGNDTVFFSNVRFKISENFKKFYIGITEKFSLSVLKDCRLQSPRDLRCRSAAARLLRLWARIPPGHGCLSVVSVLCMLSGRGFCDKLIDHSSRGVLPSVVRLECDLEPRE
jgi:hypothetical protein